MDSRALNQFLDDLAAGRPADAVEGLDRSLVETMLELRSLAKASLPASSKERVDRRVESAMDRVARGVRKDVPMNQSALTNVLPRNTGSNGYAPAYGMPVSASPAPRSARRVPRAVTWFAMAALLALTAGFGYLFFGPPRAEPEPPAIPAVVVQPATPEDASEVSFDMALSEPILPAGTIFSWSTLYSIEPGLSAEYPGFEIGSPVAAVVWVQSGTLALAGNHGVVHRGPMALAEGTPAPGELLLGPGGAVALELGGDHSYQMRSAGSEPLVFAEFWLVAGPAPSYPDPPGYRILDFYHDRSSVTLPAAAVATMHLTRMTLAADEKLEVPEDGWQMVLTDNPAPMARSWPGGVPHNIGTDPIAIVVMTADFQPVAASEATPST